MSCTRIVRLLLTFVVLVSAMLPGVAYAAPPDQEDFVEVFDQDVFVIVGSTLRNPDTGTPLDAPLFNVAGVSLELTWGDWSAASASATAQVQGGANNARTTVRLRLTGLVPNGVYSIFYGTLTPDSENPLCPGVERTLPLTAFHPEQQMPDASSFVADANGEAEYRGRVAGDLFQALQVFYTVVYHFDGQTYGSLPNRGEFLTQGATCRSSFGDDAMRQLIIWQKL